MNQKFNFNNIKNIANILMFVIFLLPASYIPGLASLGGLSMNYLFILYPLILILFKNKVAVPHTYVFGAILFYCFVFIVSVLFTLESSHFFLRKFASFFIFLSVFSFCFISIDKNQITAFKISIVLYSLLFILPPIGLLLFSEPNNIEANIKSQFGSQRYGFIYLMAFWIVYLYRPKEIPWNFVLKYIVLGLLLIGLIMTFSRSSLVSLFVSFTAYSLYEIYHSKNPLFSIIKMFFAFALACITMFFFIELSSFGPRIIDFFDKRFISVILNLKDKLDLTIDGSIGYRLYMFEKILDFIAIHPLTGSGYLGVWTLFDELSGSAHSQYFDVLFRVGIFGFIVYIVLIKRVVSYLLKCDKSLFYGFVGVLFYGFFHETFKLSHGGFLLAFLLALAFQKKSKSIMAI
jgi:O-antigen ligase